jgi:hypothetical protein
MCVSLHFQYTSDYIQHKYMYYNVSTRLCCQHADGVLLVANGADAPGVSKV